MGRELKTARAWHHRTLFNEFWNHTSINAARQFFDKWCQRAVRSRLKPIVNVARTLQLHLPGILAYITHRIINALGESLSGRIQTLKNNARGFHRFGSFRTRIPFFLGGLVLQPHQLQKTHAIMYENELSIANLHERIRELGGREYGERAKVLYKILTSAYPTCKCADILSNVIPDHSEMIMCGELLYFFCFPSPWFIKECASETSVFQFFVQNGFIPFASTTYGVFGLCQRHGSIGLNDTCVVFSEHGDQAFVEENIARFDIGLNDVLEFICLRRRAGVLDWIDDLLAGGR